MKKRTSKKSLRIMVEALQKENCELQQQAATHHAAAEQWERAAVDYGFALDSANKRLAVAEARLSKFDRRRGAGGMFVKKSDIDS